MREIKFRAWDGIRITTSGIMFNTSLGIVEVPEGSQMKLMQYTGLKDKNEVDIYEGDVVQHWVTDYDVCVGREDDNVRWNEPLPLKIKTTDYVTLENFGYWLKNECFGFEGEELVQPSECVIIGNIYENPELLK